MVLGGLAILAALQGPKEFRRHLTSDTSPAVAEARSAAGYFERGRRWQLPVSHASWGRCDERIGRFCYWYDDGDTSLPREPEAVRKSRAKLLETLALLHRQAPTSDWLIGQRVHYSIEQQAHDSAIAVATRCGGTPWWCAALLGLAYHTREQFAAADSAFEAALRAMPREIRCPWSDWTKLLDAKTAKRIEDLSCDEREPLSDSLLWLGRPLLSRPGNDFRTELLSRRVVSTLQSVAVPPFLMAWGYDVEELLMRYGWPTRWSVSDYPGARAELPSLIGHERSPAFSFWPGPADAGAAEGSLPDLAWRWDLKPERPRSRYAPSYAGKFTMAKEFQVARFPRGDSTVIVGALGLGRDPAFRGPVDLRLAAAIGPTGPAIVVGQDSLPALVSLVLRMIGCPGLVGLEANPSGKREFLRARVGFSLLPGGDSLVLSDPLFFTPGADLPESLETAAIRALATDRVSRSRPVGIYWEVSGPGADSVEVALAVIPIRRGLLGRIAQGLSLVRRRAPLTLQWRATGRADQTVGRAFELDLKKLRTGQYFLKLDAQSRGRTATSGRRFELIS
jgi:hypothetical protein